MLLLQICWNYRVASYWETMLLRLKILNSSKLKFVKDIISKIFFTSLLFFQNNKDISRIVKLKFLQNVSKLSDITKQYFLFDLEQYI
jgi:hypothetical protein